MIANGLKSPNDLYLEAKNQNMNRYGGNIYNVTLPYNIQRYFVFWLILRGDNAVLISLVTKKRKRAIMEANICYFASKMNLIPTTLKGKNIFTK